MSRLRNGTGITTKTHYCGTNKNEIDFLDVLICPTRYTDQPQRKKKSKKTSLAQAKINFKNAKRKLKRIIECNFTSYDYWVYVTYNDDNMPKNIKEAEYELELYIDRLRDPYKAKGADLKFVYVTETGKGRIHHHILLNNCIPQKILVEKWGKYVHKGNYYIPIGKVRVKHLRDNYITKTGYKSVSDVAGYMTKELSLYDGMKYRHKWHSSRNLTKAWKSVNLTKISKKQFKTLIAAPVDSEYVQTLISRLHPGYTLEGKIEKSIGEYMSSIFYQLRKTTKNKKYTAEWCKENHNFLMNNSNIAVKMEICVISNTNRIVDKSTGETLPAYTYVAMLPFSRYAYAEAISSVATASVMEATNNALRYFRGVPRVIVLKNSVNTNEKINPSATDWQNWAARNNTVIIADKQNIKQKNSNKALINELAKQFVNNIVFDSLEQLNSKLKRMLTVYNHKNLRGARYSPYDLYQDEQKELNPIPPVQYECIIAKKKAKVCLDYHVSYEKSFYSVDKAYLGRTVNIAATINNIYIYYKDKTLAIWPRAKTKNTWMTDEKHLPVDKKEQESAPWSAKHFISIAKRIGINATYIIKKVLKSRSFEVQTYRRCLGIINLAEKYGPAIFEQACAAAISKGQIYYKYIKEECETISIN